MRSDQTAQYVAARPYRDSRERDRALSQHNRRVAAARRVGVDRELAAQPLLTTSGSIVMASGDAECGVGPHAAAVVFFADSTTHRIERRGGGPCRTALCVRHWSALARDDEDDVPLVEVRFGRPLPKARP
ncbi:hypothetical protein ACH4PU_01790 [Streptomyces sp. NPDC021100]|uniref:hypothetical protein n=1 Tax=Streptomyces sp. NPDC021100 TaxID=3365114 RepID=UPI003787C5E4